AVAAALANHPQASAALRLALGQPAVAPPPIPVADAVLSRNLTHARQPDVPRPARRRLRVYAYDPSLGTNLQYLGINETVLDVLWEDGLQPGPVGEYLEVVDV